MTDQAFAQADPDWVELISLAREWFNGPLGQLMLKEEEKLLEEELGRFFRRLPCALWALRRSTAQRASGATQRTPWGAAAGGGDRL